MSEHDLRLVVCLRMPRVEEGASGGRVAALRALVERGMAHGGRLVAWLPPAFIYDFAIDGWEDALELILPAARDSRFAVGVVEGKVRTVVEQAARIALADGSAIGHAHRLSRRAQPGEVLVADPATTLRAGRWLTAKRIYWRRRQRIERVHQLDLGCPTAPAAVESLARLSPSAWVGVPPDQAAPYAKGRVTLLHAPPGAGGTRFVRELEGSRDCLRMDPGPAGEPLGALRRALGRTPEVLARLRGEPNLVSVVERLMAGAGLRPADAEALVLGWGRSMGERAIIAVEEPDRLDGDSLQAVLAGAEASAILVRTQTGGIPAGMERLPLDAELEIGTLSEDEAVVALQSMTAGTLEPSVACRFARRGGYRPLGVTEVLLAAIEAAELVWSGPQLAARGRVAGRGRPRPASYWMKQRLDRLDESSRALLDALAVFGGEAEAADLGVLSERRCLAQHLGTLTRTLNTARWVRRGGDKLIALSSATLRRRLLDAMAIERRAHLHRSLSELFESSERPMLTGPAAVHAWLAGDLQRAAELARRMGVLCRVNQLERAAGAFEQFAAGGDFDKLRAQRLTGGWVSSDAVELKVPSAPVVQPAAPVPSATRVAARAKRASVDGGDAAGAHSLDLCPVRPLPGEGRLADILALIESSPASSTTPCRRFLADALWRARAGEDADALLLALEALAEARQNADLRAERACLLLALTLTQAHGSSEAVAAWQRRLDAIGPG